MAPPEPIAVQLYYGIRYLMNQADEAPALPPLLRKVIEAQRGPDREELAPIEKKMRYEESPEVLSRMRWMLRRWRQYANYDGVPLPPPDDVMAILFRECEKLNRERHDNRADFAKMISDGEAQAASARAQCDEVVLTRIYYGLRAVLEQLSGKAYREYWNPTPRILPPEPPPPPKPKPPPPPSPPVTENDACALLEQYESHLHALPPSAWVGERTRLPEMKALAEEARQAAAENDQARARVALDKLQAWEEAIRPLRPSMEEFEALIQECKRECRNYSDTEVLYRIRGLASSAHDRRDQEELNRLYRHLKSIRDDLVYIS